MPKTRGFFSMSTFIKFEAEEMDRIDKKVKNVRNKLLNVNSSTLEAKKMIREKREMINQAFLFVNEAHEELNRIISMMPKVDSVPLKVLENFPVRINPEDHHNALVKLSDKISGLK